MPVPAATAAARATLAVLRTHRGRRIVFALGVALLGALIIVVCVLVSSVGAVLGTCQDAAYRGAKPPGSGGSPSKGSPASPSYVSQEPSEEAVSDIPPDYLSLYQKAGSDYGLDAMIIAAIGKLESDHGRSEAPGVTSGENASGAGGPMQFIASTWANVGVDGNGDGTADRYDPADAIPSAANYLKLSGAPQDYHSAILAYNNAEWYYQEVVAQAEAYRAAAEASPEGGEEPLEEGGEMASSPAGARLVVLAAVLPAPLAVQPAYAQEEEDDDDEEEEKEEENPDDEAGGKDGAVFPLSKEYAYDYENTWAASRNSGQTREDGIDISAPEGTPVRSVTRGKVVPVSDEGEEEDESGGDDLMVEATGDAGPVKRGDKLLYRNVNWEPGSEGELLESGQTIGEVGPAEEGGEEDSRVRMEWYDSTGESAEEANGAMNPYPLMEYLSKDGGGSGGSTEGANSGEGDTVTPAPEPGVPSAEVPDQCAPLQSAGLVPRVGKPSGDTPSLVSEDPASTAPGADTPPGAGSATGQQAVEEAKKYLGVPYVLGGPEVCVPGEQMDCTCLTTTVFREFGYELPDMPMEVMNYGEPVDGEPQAGDIHVWGDPGDGTYGHVAIDMGNGQIIHANMGTMDTSITPMWDSPQYMGARRLVG